MIYEKFDDEGTMRVIINCTTTPVAVELGDREIILQRGYEKGYLGINGALVLKGQYS